MSFRSMTGFGRGTAGAAGIHAEAELGCVNRKQLDINVNLPRPYAALEPQVSSLIREALSRGRVTGGVSVRHSAARDDSVTIDEGLAEACVRRLKALALKLGIEDNVTIETVVRIPGVLQLTEAAPDADEAWPVIRTAVQKALDGLLAMRIREGKALEKDVRARTKTLETLVRTIKKRAPAAQDAHREAMRRRLAEVGLNLAADDERLVKELMLHADRSDIAEEITRLESHFAQVRALLVGVEPAGRTLDFLCQELHREINTTGSKSQDPEIIRAVIDFKAELERLREQVQNIE